MADFQGDKQTVNVNVQHYNNVDPIDNDTSYQEVTQASSMLSSAINDVANANLERVKTATGYEKLANQGIRDVKLYDDKIEVAQLQQNKQQANLINNNINLASLKADSSLNSIDNQELNKNYYQYQNTLKQSQQAIVNSNLDPYHVQLVNDNIEASQIKAKTKYEKQLNTNNAQNQYTSFMQSYNSSNLAESADYEDLITANKDLINNPYLTKTQQNSVSSSMLALHHLKSNPVDYNDKAQPQGDDHLQSHIDNTISSASADNLVNDVFNHVSLAKSIIANAPNMRPSHLQNMLKSVDQVNNAYGTLTATNDIGYTLNNLSNSSNKYAQKMANKAYKDINSNNGDRLIRGMSNTVAQSYNYYNQVPDTVNGNVNTDKIKAYQTYRTNLEAYARKVNMNMSNVSEVPANVLQEYNNLDPTSLNYSDNVNKLVHNFNIINGNYSVYGTSTMANMTRAYKYASDKNNPDLNTYVAGMNDKYLNSLISSNPNNVEASDYKDWLGDSEGGFAFWGGTPNKDKIKNIALVTQTPEAEVEKGLKALYYSGGADKAQSFLDSYINNKNYRAGSNYILTNNDVSNLDIPNNLLDKYINAGIGLSLQKIENTPGINFKGNLQDWQQTQKAKYGNPADYTLVNSNGNYIAINNTDNAIRVPVDLPTIGHLKNATKEQLDNYIKKQQKQQDLNFETTTLRGI